MCHYLRAKFKLSGTVRKRYSTSEFHPNILLKSREITLPIKVCIVKAMVFPVVMCFCELDQKKAEHHRIYAFELWRWRRLLNVPWTARRSNQSILGESDSEYSLEGLMPAGCRVWAGDCLAPLHLGRGNTWGRIWHWGRVWTRGPQGHLGGSWKVKPGLRERAAYLYKRESVTARA